MGEGIRGARPWAAALAALALLMLAGSAGAVPLTVSLPVWSTDGNVIAVVTSGDTAYIGGDFSRVGPASSFAAGPFVALDGADGHAEGLLEPIDPSATQVFTSVPDGSGGWYIGGFNVLEHVRPDGSLVQPFPISRMTITALARSGSTLYVGGDEQVGGSMQDFVRSYDLATGAIGFSSVLDGFPRQLLVSGSTLYVAGGFTAVDGGAATRNHLAAFDTTTGTLTSWNPDVDGEVSAIALDGSTLYAGGQFATVNGATARSNLAAFDTTGGTVTSFDPSTNGAVDALAVNGSTLIAGGSFTAVNGSTTRHHLAAFDTSTGAASAWDPDVDGAVATLALSGNVVYAGGGFSSVNDNAASKARDNLAAFDLSTGTATSFAPSFNSRNTGSSVSTVQVDGGTVYAGGSFSSSGGVERHGLAAIDLTTGSATGFDPNIQSSGGTGAVASLALSGSRLYAGGVFSTVNGSVARNNLAAFDTGTGSATAFDPDVDGDVEAIALSGSTVYAGGGFATVNGGAVTRNRVAAFDAATGTATPFTADVSSTTIAEVHSLAVSGSTLYVGGSFTAAGGYPRNNLAAFGTTGTGSLLAFDPNVDGDVSALAVSGSTLYLGGGFDHVGGLVRGGLAAVDANGAVTAFDPEIDGDVDAIELIGSTVYAAGWFSQVNGSIPRANLASFDTSGTVTGWAPDPDGRTEVLATGDGKIVVGGSFGMLGGVVAPDLAVFDGAPGAPTGVTASAGPQQATVSFTPPTNTGADAPTTYTVTASPGGAQASGASSPITVTGLTAGTTYTFTVTASNAIAAGPASSASNAVTPPMPSGGGGGGSAGGGSSGGGSSGIPPDLTVTVSSNAANTPPAGTALIFFVKVFTKSTGGASDARLQLTLPTGFAYDHLYIDRGSCSGAAPNFTCDVAFINPSVSTNLTIFGSVATAGELRLSASVQSLLEPELDSTNNATTFTLSPVTSPGGGPPPPASPRSAARPKPLAPPQLRGKRVVGSVIRATPPTWSGKPARITYRWQLCSARRCTTIPGATHLSLKLRASFAGHTLRLVATATSAAGKTTSTSKAIAVVRAARR